jgi:hypothetical protein
MPLPSHRSDLPLLTNHGQLGIAGRQSYGAIARLTGSELTIDVVPQSSGKWVSC